MKTSDFAEVTGVELNDGYIAIESIFNICMEYSEDIARNYKAKHLISGDDRAGELQKVATDLKPILQKIQYVRNDPTIGDTTTRELLKKMNLESKSVINSLK